MSPQHVLLQGTLIWLSWFRWLIWWFGMKHPCSIGIYMRQSTGLLKTLEVVKTNHLEDWILSLEVTSSRFCLWLSNDHDLKLWVHVCRDLMQCGVVFKFWSSNGHVKTQTSLQGEMRRVDQMRMVGLAGKAVQGFMVKSVNLSLNISQRCKNLIFSRAPWACLAWWRMQRGRTETRMRVTGSW